MEKMKKIDDTSDFS